MPFNNDIAGGNGSLVRNWLQSPNFVTGVSGWQIRKDGSVEFNNGTFRGTLEVGPLTGQHFIINNPATGDIIDIYDSNNNLVMAINNIGQLVAYDYTLANVNDRNVIMSAQGIDFVDATPGTQDGALMTFFPDATTSGQPDLRFFVENSNGTNGYTLDLLAESNDGTKHRTLIGSERNKAGSMMQSDQVSTNNLVHVGNVTGTTDANGNLLITHGAQFTPNAVFVQVHDTGNLTSSFGVVTVVNATVSSTQFEIHCVDFNGTVRTNASVSVYYVCYG